LEPVLHELYKTLAELKILAERVATKAEDVKSFMEALGDTRRDLRTINKLVEKVVGVLSSFFAW
jgi:hypothetical protein